MVNSRLHYIPICLVFFFPFSLGICYGIALELGHINAFFTYISDTGTLPPEQYVFSQCMNMGAALFAYFAYIRYTQVEQYMKVRFEHRYSISNVIALAFGFVSSLGISLVGNFPELHVKEAHLLGAFVAFIGGSIYIVLQGYFTYKMLPHFQTKFIAYFRIFLGILGLMFYFGAQGAIILAFQRLKNKEKLENTPKALKWVKEDGGYPLRAASVVQEWLLVVIFIIFISTFISEFKTFRLEEPRVQFFTDVTARSEPEKKDDDEDEDFDESSDTIMSSQIPEGRPIAIVMEGPQQRVTGRVCLA